MKKILVLGALCITSSAFAAPAAVCAAPATGSDGTQITGTLGFTAANGGNTGFVVNAFTPKCSANVHAAIEQNETVLAVASGSKKGKTLFSGTTNGGSVQKATSQPTTANNGISATDVTTEATAALTAATSS